MEMLFVFEVKTYVQTLKGVLMCQFSILEQVKILSLMEFVSCLLSIQHVSLPL